jgi:hypothetical protein
MFVTNKMYFTTLLTFFFFDTSFLFSILNYVYDIFHFADMGIKENLVDLRQKYGAGSDEYKEAASNIGRERSERSVDI